MLLISIPYRYSTQGASVAQATVHCKAFQSLIGILLSLAFSFSLYSSIIFQSLIGILLRHFRARNTVQRSRVISIPYRYSTQLSVQSFSIRRDIRNFNPLQVFYSDPIRLFCLITRRRISIPYRYSTQQTSGVKSHPKAQISIPYRYSTQ